jgi:phosphatidylserine/phosphatidylglycerophosphate/cardiolipin synthase-like enzyme
VYRSKGFNIDKIRFQPRCHNKGIIADGQKVLIGSHNFTNAGMTANRDASLLVEHDGVAAYYRKFFEHDWRVAGKLAEEAAARPRMLLAMPGELPPPGMSVYSLWELLDAD